MTTDTFICSPVTTNAPRKKTDVPNERQISLDSLTETTKELNRLTLQLTSNNSEYYHSDKNDAKIDPKSDQVVATHTSDRNKRKVTATDTAKRNHPHKLLTNQKIPAIIPAVIPPVNQTPTDGVATNGRTFHVICAVFHKYIVTGATCSAARVFKDPPVENWKGTGGTILRDRNTLGIPPRSTTPVRIGTGPSVPPIHIRDRILRVQGCPSFLRKSGTPIHSALPLIEFLPNIGTLRQFRVRSLVKNSSTDTGVTYTHRVGLTSQVTPSSPKVRTSWIWGCRPSTQQMNLGTSSPSLPELARQRMDPTGSCVSIVLVKLQRIE